MAKTPVKIEIDGYKEREVQMVTYEFDQATDTEGQMSGIPRGGKIVLERNLPKNGKITFNETKTGKVMKTIEFEGGYCVDFEEKWQDKAGHFEEISISCQKIKFGSVQFENEWA